MVLTSDLRCSTAVDFQQISMVGPCGGIKDQSNRMLNVEQSVCVDAKISVLFCFFCQKPLIRFCTILNVLPAGQLRIEHLLNTLNTRVFHTPFALDLKTMDYIGYRKQLIEGTICNKRDRRDEKRDRFSNRQLMTPFVFCMARYVTPHSSGLVLFCLEGGHTIQTTCH